MLLTLLACTLPGAPGVPAPPAPPEGVATPEVVAKSGSPGDIMDRMARHAASLYFAGQTGETALAKWEIAEIREQVEELEGLSYNGVSLGPAAQEALNGPLTGLEAATAPAEQETAYAALVVACNDCHAKTGVPFIQITTPRNPPWSNVKYGEMGRGGPGTRMAPGAGMGGGMGPAAGMGPRGGADAAQGGDEAGAAQRPRRPGMGPRGGGRPDQGR